MFGFDSMRRPDMRRRLTGRQAELEAAPSVELAFYVLIGLIAFVAAPFILKSDIIEDDGTRAVLMFLWALVAIAVGGFLSIGLCATIIRIKMPVTFSIMLFLIQVTAAVMMSALVVGLFFVVIPLTAFVAACTSSAKKARR
jgi:hypothetical protein